MSGTRCCGAMAGSCFCGVDPEDSPGHVPMGFTREEWQERARVLTDPENQPLDFTPITPARMAELAAIGFDEVGQVADLTEEDAIQVLAFHKFLTAGEWKAFGDERMYVLDQAGFDYATGKLSASDYLESELGSAKNQDPEPK